VGIEDGAFDKTLGSLKSKMLLCVVTSMLLLSIYTEITRCRSTSYLLQVVSGGVASNQYVRARLDTVVKKNGLQLVCPPPRLCTDNGNHAILCFDFNDEG
jgi:tRNA A37 threonylcarbamoyltransferase TsaD